ncbi:MAG: hypothetical protein LC804_16255 [Acidobacteria bacterium]|nr:hypothetical protein [Acidobacteriota bacterium]
MHRLLPVLLLLLPLSAAAAEAVTVRDLIELTRAGLSDDVLLALIEVDRGVFAIDTDTLKTLKEAGVSERVIVALVRSGRVPPPVQDTFPMDTELPQPEPPQVVVIDHHEPERIREVPIPIYIPVDMRGRHGRGRVLHQPVSDFIPFSGGRPVRASDPSRIPAREPVYWGFGGKLRPDAWKPKR